MGRAEWFCHKNVTNYLVVIAPILVGNLGKDMHIITRYFVWQLAAASTLYFFIIFLIGDINNGVLISLFLSVFLFSIGVYDQLQNKHAILKNYPIIGHLRFWLEFIRPEIRQYFIESDTEKLPFSRNQRALVYQRAKNLSGQRPFGTIDNVYQPGYEWFSYSNAPLRDLPDENLTVEVGKLNCTQPYDISIFNISAMSFGALSANAILALNKGAKMGNFAHDTGEGSISPYHRKYGGDLIWEIGSGYFGCRTPAGEFDLEEFTRQAQDPQIKMIEIKLSQGAKPGHGGILPAAKITPEIAQTRGVPMGIDCVSPSRHTAFNTPVEMMQFMALLRQRSGGKPVGFKLCIGMPREWFSLLKAMLETNLLPDFIVIDGSEGGTGAAPVEFIDHLGMPMRDSLRLIHASLVGANLRDNIKLAAAGKIISAFDIARACAIGADWCNSARGFMFAIGCIQSRTCNTDRCPTGVATQNNLRQKALDPIDKGERVYQFHKNTIHALREILAAAGLSHTSEIRPDHVMRRSTDGIAQPYYTELLNISAGSLVSERPAEVFKNEYAYLAKEWEQAKANSW